MIDSRLQIRRVHAEYLVPSDHPSPRRIRDRLDQDITRSLSHTLSTAFASWFPETDSSLWFVRRLDIDLAVNASGGGRHVARAFTQKLANVLGNTLQDRADHDNVMRFASPADYLAQFLLDLAAGHAWGRWYYESFFGLRMLSTSAALRTAICDLPERGRAALLHLQNAELKNVLRALNRQDTQRILEGLTQEVSDDSSDSSEMASSLAQLVDGDSTIGLGEWGRALYLYLHAARERQERGLYADSMSALLHCSPRRLCEVAERLNAIQISRPGIENAETDRRHTSFGGSFLLLPLIDDLPLVEGLRDWPNADQAAAISLVRFLLLIKCAGPEYGRRTFSDPLLRDLLLVLPDISVEVLKDWQSHITATHIQSFLRTLIDWQRVRGRVTDRIWAWASTEVNGSPVSVLIDQGQDLWLFVRRHSDCELAKNIQRSESLSSDLSYLSLPDSMQFSPDLDLALSVAAQHVLRSFARRLPGFAQSNLPYLSRNFLEFSASHEDEPARRVVRLCSPPLRLVLSITGMMRHMYRLSWLDERPCVLFEES
jgi:hypothetical protein